MLATITRPSRRAGRRRGTSVLALALALLAVPSVATASPPVESSDVALTTDPGPIALGDATIDFNIFFSALVGPRGDITYNGPLGSLFGTEGLAEMDGNRLVGEYGLVNIETGEYAGRATYELLFAAAGEVEMSERTIRDGNRRIVLEFTEQPMVASGHVTMPDGMTFSVVDAPAERLTVDGWSSEPRSTILDGTDTLIEATWLVDGTPVTFRGNVTNLQSAGAVFLHTAEEEIIGLDEPVLVDDAMTASFVLQRPDRSVAGTAEVALEIATLGNSTSFEVTELGRLKVITDEIHVTGTMLLTLDGVSHELSFADAEVSATRSTWHGIQYPFADDTEG
jgi:hypothetical protein